jgi:hypothetical protein
VTDQAALHRALHEATAAAETLPRVLSTREFVSCVLCERLDAMCGFLAVLRQYDMLHTADRAQHGAKQDPPLCLLSLLELRVLYTTLELIWRWGSAPILSALGVRAT